MSGVNKSFNLGRAKITCVAEYVTNDQVYSQNLVPFDPTIFADKSRLLPKGYSNEDTEMVINIQNWLIQVDGRNILIDTGFGNDKSLPGLPPKFSFLNTPFLDNLRAAGVTPEEIDTVVITHVHVDHIGWNTYWDGHQWAPTFPNARHVVTDVERHYWDTTSPHYNPKDLSRAMMQDCFEESLLPIIREGLVHTVGVDQAIDDILQYVPAPGHTPGQSAIKLVCDGEGILFAGDAMHHPIQILLPEWCIAWDEDPEASIKSRKRLLNMCAEEHLILAPAHFTRHACRVERTDAGFLARNLEMTEA